MPKKTKPVFVRFNTIKDYVKESQKMRSNEAAVNNLIERFNSLIENNRISSLTNPHYYGIIIVS